eukprot:2263381-Pyramimonas_sp.AAC.1
MAPRGAEEATKKLRIGQEAIHGHPRRPKRPPRRPNRPPRSARGVSQATPRSTPVASGTSARPPPPPPAAAPGPPPSPSTII